MQCSNLHTAQTESRVTYSMSMQGISINLAIDVTIFDVRMDWVGAGSWARLHQTGRWRCWTVLTGTGLGWLLVTGRKGVALFEGLQLSRRLWYRLC